VPTRTDVYANSFITAQSGNGID